MIRRCPLLKDHDDKRIQVYYFPNTLPKRLEGLIKPTETINFYLVSQNNWHHVELMNITAIFNRCREKLAAMKSVKYERDFNSLTDTFVRLQNLPSYKTGLVSRQVLHLLSKLQKWIWPKTGRYKTSLVSNTKIEASKRAIKPKPWQSHLTSDTVEIFTQNEKAGLMPMQSRFRSRHKAGFGAAGLGTAQSWFWSRHNASFGAVSRPV